MKKQYNLNEGASRMKAASVVEEDMESLRRRQSHSYRIIFPSIISLLFSSSLLFLTISDPFILLIPTLVIIGAFLGVIKIFHVEIFCTKTKVFEDSLSPSHKLPSEWLIGKNVKIRFSDIKTFDLIDLCGRTMIMITTLSDKKYYVVKDIDNSIKTAIINKWRNRHLRIRPNIEFDVNRYDNLNIYGNTPAKQYFQ